MQKKILASLLMVPMAYSAFANIGVTVPSTKDDWKANGLVGDNLKIDEDGVEALAPIGTGYISQTIENQPQGTYHLTFATEENVAVKVNGKALENGTFKLDAAGDITITIGSEDPAKVFKFTGLTLEIECDFDAIQEALTAQLMKDLLGKVDQVIPAAVAANFENAVTLDNEGKDLEKKIGKGELDSELKGSVRGAIREIRAAAAEGTSYEDAIAVYNKYQLWLGAKGCTVATEMKSLTTELTDHNAEVKKCNDRWNTKVYNEGVRDALLEGVKTLEANLKALKDERDAAVEAAVENGKYIKDKTQDGFNAIEKAIADYKTAIETAYAEEKLPEPITFTDQQPTIQAQIDALKVTLDTAVADVEKYEQWLVDTRDFLADYKQASLDIADVTGVEGYEDNYDERKAKAQADIEDLYVKAVEKFEIKKGEIEGAAAKYADDKATMDKATAAIQKVASDLVELAKAQNEEMTKGLEAIAGVEAKLTTAQELLDKLTTKEDAAEAVAKLTDSLKAITDALAAAKTDLEAEYKECTLPVDGFDATVAGIDANADAFIAAIKPIITLWENLEAAEADLNKTYKDRSYFDKFIKKFDTVIDNIEDAIVSLIKVDENGNVEAVTEEMTAPVQEAIDAIAVNAELLAKAWDAALAYVDGFADLVKDFDSMTKLMLNPEGKTFAELLAAAKETKAYNDLLDEYTQRKNEYDVAVDLESQDCYNAMTELAAKANIPTVTTKFNELKKGLDEQGSELNDTYVQGKIADLKEEAEGEYKGKEDILSTIAGIEDALAEIEAVLDGLNDADIADYTHAKYDTTVDVPLSNLVAQIAEVSATIKEYKELQAIYDQFVIDLGKLQEAINNDTKYNENVATEPAKSFWTGEIAKMQTAKDELKAEVEAAYEAYNDSKKNLKAVKDDLTKKYDDQLAAANALPANIEANENANSYLLSHSNEIRTSINQVIDDLKGKLNEANAQGADDIAAELTEWIDELNDLLINNGCEYGVDDKGKPVYIDLAGIDREEKADFAVGIADDNFDALKAKYDAVKAKFDKLKKQYYDKYAEDLTAWNNDFLGTQWQAALNELLDSYKKAIKTYDQYLYGLHNEGYKAFIAETLEDHRDIYKYIDKINALETEVNDYVKAQTEAGHLISAAEFKAAATDKQEALNNDINTEVSTMEAQVEAKAEEFFEINVTEATEIIAQVKTNLTQNGVSDDITSEALAPYNNKLAKAIDAEDNAKTDETIKYGIEMDNIANYLDDAKKATELDVDAVAQTQWTEDLLQADTKVAELQAIVDAAEFATDTVAETEGAKFKEALEIIEALKAAPYSPATLDTLIGLQDALRAALQQAEDAANAIKASSDANKANKDAYEKYTGTIIPDYENALAELTKFVNGLSAGEEATLTAPTAAVEALKTFVEDNKNNLTAKTTELKDLEDAIKAAIETAYGTTVTDENALLDEWIGRLKAAYNDAKVNSGNENFDTEYTEVKAFIDANSTETGIDLPSYSDANFNKAEYLENAGDLEFYIADYYNELQGLWAKDANGNDNPNQFPYNEAKAAIEAAMEEAAQNLNDGYAALEAATELKTVDEEAYNDFVAQYEAAAQKIEALQGEVAGKGVRIILDWQEYVSKYAALSSEFAALAEEVVKAQADATDTYAKWQASDARAAELQGVIDGLETELEALKNKVAEYGINNTAVNDEIEAIEADIETAKANLEAAKEAHSLTADSVLDPDDAAISSAIYGTGLNAAKAYADKGVDEATEASSTLTTELKKNIVPAIAEALLAEQLQLNAQLEAVKNAIAAVDMADVNTTAATFEDLHDQAAAIKARLEEMLEEATENVFVLGDVDGDPDGLVTAADVQLLIQWVGEGKTYEDLYAMSPVVAAAANVAQEPGQAPAINIADITAEINLVMNFDYDTPATRTFVQRRAAAEGSINAVALGNGRYAINLNSTQAFVAGQIDLVLGGDAKIVNAELAGMSHQLYQFENDGYTRMIVASMSNEELKGDQLLIIEVEGNGAVQIDNAIFTDANANSYTLGKAGASGIDSIEAENGMIQRIYNAAGQAMRSIQRGINIIRHSDGTVTKELRK